MWPPEDGQPRRVAPTICNHFAVSLTGTEPNIILHQGGYKIIRASKQSGLIRIYKSSRGIIPIEELQVYREKPVFFRQDYVWNWYHKKE